MESETRPKILVVCMVDSIHVARWLKQFEGQKLDFFIFPSGPNRRVHPELAKLLAGRAGFSLHWSSSFGLAFWALDQLLNNWLRGTLLKMWIDRIAPDIVHAIEIQGAGYLALNARRAISAASAQLLVTNYGSDIFWFQNFKGHRIKIQKLLRRADYYSAECERDISLALKHGFQGKALPVIPNAGGVSVLGTAASGSPNSSRKTIAVKGYHGWVGRAHAALWALQLLKEEIRDFDIEVFSANFTTRIIALYLRKFSKMSIRVFSKNALSHFEMQELFGRSSVYVGVSKSDGISTSMLEAMANGAIPVQTTSACCSEWFTDTGVPLNEINKEAIADGIRQGLRLASDGHSARLNRETIMKRADKKLVSEIARSYYELPLRRKQT